MSREKRYSGEDRAEQQGVARQEKAVFGKESCLERPYLCGSRSEEATYRANDREKGKISENEDRAGSIPERGCVYVFDGVGGGDGAGAGGVASGIAENVLWNTVTELAPDLSLEETENAIVGAIEAMNTEIADAKAEATAEREEKERRLGKELPPDPRENMASTVTIAKIWEPEGGGQKKMVFGWQGDSRIYVLTGGRFLKVTKDDNSATADQEAKLANHPFEMGAKNGPHAGLSASEIKLFEKRNEISNCAGMPEYHINMSTFDVSEGDMVFCVSDGISDALTTDWMEEIVENLRSQGRVNPADISAALIEAARGIKGAEFKRAKNDDASVAGLYVSDKFRAEEFGVGKDEPKAEAQEGSAELGYCGGFSIGESVTIERRGGKRETSCKVTRFEPIPGDGGDVVNVITEFLDDKGRTWIDATPLSKVMELNERSVYKAKDGEVVLYEGGTAVPYKAGEFVNVERSDGSVESDWFIASMVIAKSGMDVKRYAVVQKFDPDESGTFVMKPIAWDNLRRLNSRGDDIADTGEEDHGNEESAGDSLPETENSHEEDGSRLSRCGPLSIGDRIRVQGRNGEWIHGGEVSGFQMKRGDEGETMHVVFSAVDQSGERHEDSLPLSDVLDEDKTFGDQEDREITHREDGTSILSERARYKGLNSGMRARVERSDGTVENDWFVTHFSTEGDSREFRAYVNVQKIAPEDNGTVLTKRIPAEKFMRANQA